MVGRWQTYWSNMAHGIPYSNTVTSGLSYMYVHSRQIFYCVTYSLTRYSPVALLLLRLHILTQHGRLLWCSLFV